MLELVFANLRVRPFRTLISVIGVALGVVLVVLFTGLARGMTNDMAKPCLELEGRDRIHSAGAMELDKLERVRQHGLRESCCEIEGVQSTVPVIRYITPDTTGPLGNSAARRRRLGAVRRNERNAARRRAVLRPRTTRSFSTSGRSAMTR